MALPTVSVRLIVEPLTPTDSARLSDIPFALQVASPGPYADRDPSGIRVAAWGAGLCDCCRHVVPNCCMATLCPCVSLAQIAARAGAFRFRAVLCGLFAVATVQALAAVVAFAQVCGDDGAAPAPSERGVVRWDHVDPRVRLGESLRSYHGDGNDNDPRADSWRAFADLVGSMATTSWSVFCLALSCVYVLLAWRLRGVIRARSAIRGSWLGDLLVALLLPCCNVVQMATHVKSYTPRQCAFGAPDVLPAYPPVW
ncbi:hypothetical protein PybrP1_010613 [[Pythium] brassicae (nom. inval.)]|nr:hypothetical protein PybrP1_010613 [[Pythium] brassicae (nom. inval.)]